MTATSRNTMSLCLSLLGLVLTAPAEAGLLCHPSSRATAKCCDCAPTFQPRCCRPQIVRPQCFHAPQCRNCGAKPDACYAAECPDSGCCPVVSCVPAEAPAPGTCDSCLPADSCCATGTPCELATLIHQSQTACHSWQRRDAIHKLSDRYSCNCYPEVMPALVLALNDCDERVRSKAADEIGDQLRCHPQCCSCSVLSALKYALGDCDRFVRRQAEEALRAAGYDVVDSGCDTGECGLTCVPRSSNVAAPEQVIAPTQPAPPVDPNLLPGPSDSATPAPGATAPPPAEGKKLPSRSAGDQYSPMPDAPVPAPQQKDPPPPGQAPSAAAPRRFFEPGRAQPLREGLTELFN